MDADFKFDDREFRVALKRFEANSTKTRGVVLKDQARLFVNDVFLITPPNFDYKQHRASGERAIAADIKKIMRGARDGTAGAIEDPSKLHKKYRSTSTGRVNKTLPPAQKFRVINLPAYIKKMQARVGILASGWVAAGSKLGSKVPDWAARHGTSGGRISIVFGIRECRITITNAVKFAGGVKGLVRRVQHALDTRAGAMNRQLDHYQRQSARSAGFR